MEVQFLHHNYSFDVLRFSEEPAFNPFTLGLKPQGWSTNCARGYIPTYSILKDNLILASLDINLSKGDSYERLEGPEINGIKPSPPDKSHGFNNVYRDMNYPLNYSGGVVIGHSFIGSHSMDVRSPWKYKHLIELIFEDGELIQEIDLSLEVGKMRAQKLDYQDFQPQFEKLTTLKYKW
jgi:hypothetical protein